MHADLAKLGRIAIVNRGEPAMRCIHAVRETAAEHGVELSTVALHTDAERRAMFVREADEAVRIGPGPGEPPAATNPYLDYVELERALTDARADAVWVGWGFVAEHADFADLCDRLGIIFIGPTGAVMRELGDKIGAKRLAERSGVPVAPWSSGPVADTDEAVTHAQAIGYPLVVKAAAGGGGRGIRLVHDPADLALAFERARDEAAKSFGDATLFMEKLVAGARHIEVQVIADHHGGVWAAGVRDCSIQRRNQKVLEESASTALDAQQVAEIKEAAAELARAAGYHNAGTVEFLYQPEERIFAFLEVNTRLQVEHPVTEMTTDLDLVKLQLHVAAGGSLDGEAPPTVGHAIEVRLNAEDAERGFSPSPGTIERLALPTGPGLRVDTGVTEGDEISPQYDSMIAKIIAYGPTRQAALARLRRGLSQTTVLVRGGTTNRAFLLDLLNHPTVIAGDCDTGWLDRLTADGGYRFDTAGEVALIAAAIDAADAAATVTRDRFYASAARGRPQTTTETGVSVDLRYAGTAYRLEVARTGPSRYLLEVDGHRILAEVEPLRPFERRLTIRGERYRVAAISQGADTLVEVDGVPHRISQDDAGLIRAPGPSVVVAISASVGDVVSAGGAVAVLESMKMETVLTAPFTGRVTEVFATGNVQLDAAAPVVRLEAIEEDDEAPTEAPVAFDRLVTGDLFSSGAEVSTLQVLDAIRRLALGFDVPMDAIPRMVEHLEGHAEDDPTVVAAELDVLSIFADLHSLTRNRRADDGGDTDEPHNAREYLHAYLRSLDPDVEGLPETFRERLRRALAHHGITSLDRSPELEEALYRVHLAQQRAGAQVPVILALLQRLRDRGASSAVSGADGADGTSALREVLDQLIRATQVRHPVIGDLARRVRYRCCDQPRLDAERDAALDEVRTHLDVLSAQPDTPEYDERMTALIAAQQPLLGLLADPLVTATGWPILLEVLTRRYYRTRDVEQVEVLTTTDLPTVVADFSDRRGRGRVVAVAADADDLDDALRNAATAVADVPDDAGAGVVADVYLTRYESVEDLDELLTSLTERLQRASLPPLLRRVTLSIVSPTRADASRSSVEHLTFRRNDDGHFVERKHLRGIHPLIAGRLDLWRFERFRLRRLPSEEDVYLFEAVARETPADVRLFAMAEVRDLTPVRDASGTVTALPELERIFAACIDDLRHARAGYVNSPDWNRVMLNVWPPVDVPIAELDGVVRALAPMTENLGLEQVMVQAQLPSPGGRHQRMMVRMYRPPGQGLTLRVTEPPTEPMEPFDELTQKVVRARRRGTVHPSEIVPLITRSPEGPELTGASGSFIEHDLDDDGRLVPIERGRGQNTASIVVGIATVPTSRYPEGMSRVALLGDPTKGLGSIAEAECRRIIAALDLAESRGLPVEWFAVSSGARIAMDSGTENMDWVAAVLRRIITFTQAGGEINVVVTGINVGAQPYWNAEATMLMHTRGILVMTPDSAMVLTGKQALDYSGGVSAEDNFGIGGYDRVMGPNGQAQYWAADLAGARDILFAHYAHSYVAPGDRFPRPAPTTDLRDRDVRSSPHVVDGIDFTTIGDIFSEDLNPGRKKPFDIRALLRAVMDADHVPLERWVDMADAQMAVVYDTHLGGYPVTLLGIESRPIQRRGLIPADGPDQWSAGTLFPRASKKVARAINAASGTRPVVVLANLSGFDGSPESLRQLQLEYGAEIGRAVVNFDGPIVFCVVSRYHGGAFVVFSQALNEAMEVAAVEGSHASVIGGPPAAAVVFAGEVNRRTDADPRVQELEQRIADADNGEVAQLRAQLEDLRSSVRSEKLGQVAGEFDAVHSVQRAQEVGSIDHIVSAQDLRPYLIDAVERGMASVHDELAGGA